MARALPLLLVALLCHPVNGQGQALRPSREESAEETQTMARVIERLKVGESTERIFAALPPVWPPDADQLPQPADDATPTQTHHDAWINSGHFEGDIIGVQQNSLFDTGVQHNGVRSVEAHWTKGLIPFSITSSFSNTERALITAAMKVYHAKSCVRFVARTFEQDYLHIVKGYGCYSMVGKSGGRQALSLGGGCVHHEIIVHELMHAVGFWHEHSRADRDGFLRVLWDNIQPGMQGQFRKTNAQFQDNLGEPYDYRSVMHYESTAFSRNGLNTLETLQAGYTSVIGRAPDLSATDLRKINKLYGCETTSESTTTRRPIMTTTRILLTTTKRSSTKKTTSQPTTENLCGDQFMDCAFFYEYCNRWNFYRVMAAYCPKTCGYCDGRRRLQPTKLLK